MKDRTLAVRVSKETYAAIEVAAEKAQRTVSAWCRLALEVAAAPHFVRSVGLKPGVRRAVKSKTRG